VLRGKRVSSGTWLVIQCFRQKRILDPIVRMIMANMGKWERTKSHICWDRAQEEPELVARKSPLGYAFHASREEMGQF